MALDRIDDLAMPAVLALHVHGDDGVERGNEQQRVKDKPEDQAGNDQNEVEHRRERLPVEQQAERRHERGEDVDHRDVLVPLNAAA